MAHKSRYVKEVIRVPHPEKHEEEFVDAVLQQKGRFAGCFLVPGSDETLAVVARHKTRLAEHFVVACPEWEIVSRYIEKKHTYRLAEAFGVPVPKTVVPASAEDVERYAAGIEFPCLVKPSQSHLFYPLFKTKMIPVRNLDEMIAVYRQSAEYHLEVMLQEIIPGDDDAVVNYNAYAWEGRSLVEFTARHIRNAPPWWGSPRVALSEWIPEVIEPGRKALQSIGFYGYACTEFKRDARDGVYKLMEINGRHNLSGLLAVRCGINFPWLHYLHLMNGTIPEAGKFREGVYWIDIARDLGYSLMYFRKEKYPWISYVRPYFKPHVFAILDLKDMKPFARRCCFLAKQLFPGEGREQTSSRPALESSRREVMEKKWIACNVCGVDQFKPVNCKDGWTIGRCQNCGLVYVNPTAVFKPDHEFSKISLGFQYTRFQSLNLSADIIEFEKRQLLENRALLEKLSESSISDFRFLDVGCGSGASVRAAAELGWKAVGIDIDPELVEKGRAELQVDLRCTTLLDAHLEKEQFHFIRLRDVIEHLPNPYEVLMEIKHLLVPGGSLLVSSPNEGSLPTTLRLLCGCRRRAVATVPPPHHLHGFNRRTLKRIFERAGLTVHEIKSTTPVDPAYVTSRNMLSSQNPLSVVLWNLAEKLEMGSMLIGWAGKGTS
jgi:predicted ATP-grasp superfamily ATP-dependent carboligase/2-polyprenyl-3-methyl-5-hydroxy-6-metoxy-1,4-benzoquinol methylase